MIFKAAKVLWTIFRTLFVTFLGWLSPLGFIFQYLWGLFKSPFNWGQKLLVNYIYNSIVDPFMSFLEYEVMTRLSLENGISTMWGQALRVIVSCANILNYIAPMALILGLFDLYIAIRFYMLIYKLIRK